MQIKIYTLLNTKNNYNSINNKYTPLSTSENNITSISNICYRPISFKGVEDNYLSEQLLDLKDVHCPICGTVMPDDEKIDEIMQDFKTVKNADNFVEFLARYEENIHPKFRSIVSFSKTVADSNPDMSSESLMKILSSGSMKKYAAATRTTVYDINNFIENNKNELSDNDILLMYKYNEEVSKMLDNKTLNYKKYKEILQETLKNLETDKKWEIHDKVKHKVRDASLYRYIFTKPGSITGIITPETVIKNLFDMSTAALVRVSDTIDNPNVEYNKVLECKHCKDSKMKLPYLLMHKFEGVNENFDKYIEDVSNAAINGKLYKNTSYPLKVNALTKNLGKIERDKKLNAVLSQVKNIDFQEGLKEIEFKILDFSDVPCSCCGKKTYTHSEKKQIENEIKNAKNFEEIDGIVHKYYKDIRENYKPLINEFQRIIKERPKISDEDMIKLLKSFCNNEINKTLEKSVKRFKDPDVLIKYSPQARQHIKEYVRLTEEKFLNLSKKKPFPYSEYYGMLVKTIGKIDDFSKDKILYGMKMSVKRKYFPQVLLYGEKNTAANYDSFTKYVISTVITKAVATKDHLQASNLGGSNGKENLVVMCKDCNNEKGTDDFIYFLKHHGQFKHNFVKYLKKVNELVKSGSLTGYDNYIHDIIKHINDDLMEGAVLFDENMI